MPTQYNCKQVGGSTRVGIEGWVMVSRVNSRTFQTCTYSNDVYWRTRIDLVSTRATTLTFRVANKTYERIFGSLTSSNSTSSLARQRYWRVLQRSSVFQWKDALLRYLIVSLLCVLVAFVRKTINSYVSVIKIEKLAKSYVKNKKGLQT